MDSLSVEKAHHGELSNNDKQLTIDENLAVLCYLRGFLAKPHPLVGREGPVCPFIPQSLRRNTLYIGIAKGVRRREDARQIMLTMADRFAKLEPTEGRARQFKAVIIVFPSISTKLRATL